MLVLALVNEQNVCFVCNISRFTFDREGNGFEKHIKEAFAMVSFAPADNVARAIESAVHARSGTLADEYWIGVSLLERLVEWLPQRVLDAVVQRALGEPPPAPLPMSPFDGL